MADERLLITIEGKDGVSKTFVAISKSADAAGTSVERAGKRGESAMKGLADETKRTAATADELERRYTAIGASIGTALGVVSKLGASFRDQRLDLQSLEAQYGSASDTVIAFTETIQDSMNQSNDAARDSALVFATLFRNYEMGEQQIIDLMGRSADIAAARGRSMTEVSQMVQNALRGEAEYIEQIGVTLNDTYVASEYAARGLGNWNTLTDEAAKAQFRYVLLMEQTIDTQGRAAEEAERAGGTMRRWINEAQDAGQTIGGMLGPLGEMGAEFSQIALGLPIIAGMFGKLVGTVRNSTMAMSALSMVMNPWVLGATAAVAVGAALWNSYREGAEVIATLKDAYLDLAAASDAARAQGNPEVAARIDQLRFQAESVRAEADAIERTMQAQSQYVWNGVHYDRDAWLELTASYEITREESERLAASQGRLNAALQSTNIDGAALAAEMDRLYWQFMRGEISADQYIMAMEDLSNNTSRYAVTLDDAAAAQERLNAALADGVLSVGDMGLMARIAVLGIDEIANASRRATRDANDTGRARRRTIDLILEEAQANWLLGYSMRELAGQIPAEQELALTRSVRANTLELIANENAVAGVISATDRLVQVRRDAFHDIGAGVLGIATEEIEAYNAWIETVADNLNRLLDVSGYDDPLSRWNLAGNATDMSLLAMNANQAASALDSVYRVAVGNTDAWAQQADGIHRWAQELIGAQGEYSKLDDLVNAGRISGQAGVFTGDSEYAQAQRAYNDIARENAEIQEHVLTIQAKQAPLIRDQMVAYENYMQTIADLPAAQQQIALGWADATTSARAFEFQTLAIAAANGELGENGEQAFTSMIVGAAQADPYLKAILIDMGLIEEGADGTITVNFDGLEEGRSEIGALNETIGILIDLLDDGEINGSFSIDATDSASPVIRTARQNLADADGESATMSIFLNDYASLGISAANAALNALDGRVATTTVRTIYESQGLGPGKASGGVIGYAGGGVIAELAEAGPEIVHFASGGSAWVGQRGVYNLSPGDYVVPHNQVSTSYGGVNVTFTGNFYGSNRAELDEWAETSLVPAFVSVLNDERRGQPQ